MTAVLPVDPRSDLDARLDALRHRRDEVLLELLPPAGGDDADRATNVDGHATLSLLDRQISDLEETLASVEPAAAGDGVRLGVVLTLDFGDGPEDYLFGTVAYAGPDVDVVTPESPLGRSLQNATPGQQVSYSLRGRVQNVTLVAIN